MPIGRDEREVASVGEECMQDVLYTSQLSAVASNMFTCRSSHQGFHSIYPQK